jgi:exosortase
MTTHPLIRKVDSTRLAPTPQRRGSQIAGTAKARASSRAQLLSKPTPTIADEPDPQQVPSTALVLFVVCAAAGIWSYWPTFANLMTTWNRVADYSHGYLVLPIAIFFLWARRESCPPLGRPHCTLAVALLAVAVAVRGAGDIFFFTFLDGWSVLPWTAALAAALGGWPLLRWAAPAIAFLIFMVPLPFSMENDLSGPLQRLATRISTTTLQCLGQMAFAEGNTIWLGEDRLDVEQACSGLRLFMGIMALTYVCVFMLGRPWWERIVLLLAAAPVAIIANSLRIVATGWLYTLTTDVAMRKAVHDVAGYSMLVVAGLMFLPLIWFLQKLIREEEVMDISAVLKHSQG